MLVSEFIFVWELTKIITTANTTTPQSFYGSFSGTTRVSQCQKRSSGLYGAKED